jgi:general secretion pathway protein A
MYLSFYGLSEKPFSQTPDPKFLYWNDHYRETIASLRYGIQERKGFITMIGEAGTGKTTLLRKLLDDLGPDVVSVFLFNPNASFEEILEYTLSELGIPAASGRKLAMMQRLNDFLLAAFQEGKNTILLIDEAQDLETEVLESLRLLSNLETSTEKILQIVLSGQPELATRLAQPNLRQLKQRIAVRCRIEPLGRNELPDYIAARLSVAGGRSDLFAPATLDPIWEFARGIPRLINTVCDNALLVGYALGRETIDAEVIGEVVHDLGRIDAPYEPTPVAAAPLAVAAPPVAVAPAPREEIAAPQPAAGAAGEAAPRRASAPAEPTVVAPAAPVPPPVVAPQTRAPESRPTPARPTIAAATRPADRLGTEPRRRHGTALAASLLLIVAAAAAFAAFRWNEIRPRLLALLADGQAQPAGAPLPPAVSADEIARDRRVGSAPAAPVPAVQDARQDPPADPPAPAPVVASEPEAAAPVPPAVVAGSAPSGSAPTSDAAPAADAPEPAPVVSVAEAAPPPRAATQDLKVRQQPARSAKRILVQRGDTLMNLAAREYGYATYTVLDVVRSANPGIQDVDRIIAGSELLFPDPGPGIRVSDADGDVSVLVATTPVLGQAQEIQRLVGTRYRLPADLEPVALGDGRSLYRVSLRKVPDQTQALQIAESLGSILRDPS